MSNPSQTVYLPASTGPAYWGPGDTYTFLLTGEQSGGAMFILEAQVSPGGGPPLHIHHREDESFYILQGSLIVRVADRTIRASVGDFVHIPKGTLHSFFNDGEKGAWMLAIFTPAGMEHYFSEALEPATPKALLAPMGEIIGRMVAAATHHGVEFVQE